MKPNTQNRQSRFSREARGSTRPFVEVHFHPKPKTPVRDFARRVFNTVRYEADAWSAAAVRLLDLCIFTVVDGVVDTFNLVANGVESVLRDKVVQSLALLSMRVVVAGLILLPAMQVLRELAFAFGELHPVVVDARESFANYVVHARFPQ